MTKGNQKNISKSSFNLPFYNQLGQFFLTYSKEEVLENANCHLDLFELYLDTEMACDLDLRRKMLMSTIRIKELAAIIQSFAPDEIEEESLILAENE